MANTSKKSLDINGLEYVASKVMTLVNSGGTADYLVEEGTEDIWTYCKWASGIAECWGIKSIGTVAITSPWGNIYSAGTAWSNATYPSNLFITTPTCTATVTAQNEQTVVPCYSASSNPLVTTPRIYYVRGTSATLAGVEIQFYAKGLWKEFTPDIMKTPSLDLYYPVGSIYISASSTFDPNVSFGGTWVKLTDKFLVGAGNTYALGTTGGEASVQLDPTHYQHTAWQTDRDGKQISTAFNVGTYYGIGTNYTGENTNVPHNNLPPYQAVFMWQRTA